LEKRTTPAPPTNAIRAAAQLKVSWKPTPTLPDLGDVETALRANPSTPRTLIDKGDVDAAIALVNANPYGNGTAIFSSPPRFARACWR